MLSFGSEAEASGVETMGWRGIAIAIAAALALGAGLPGDTAVAQSTAKTTAKAKKPKAKSAAKPKKASAKVKTTARPKKTTKKKAKRKASTSPCQGLSQSACGAKSTACSWIRPKKKVSSDGRKLTAYCRKRPAKRTTAKSS
ncbi:MAG: hypothetical protein AAFV26_05700 [Pseudomonadota bacterium]